MLDPSSLVGPLIVNSAQLPVMVVPQRYNVVTFIQRHNNVETLHRHTRVPTGSLVASGAKEWEKAMERYTFNAD